MFSNEDSKLTRTEQPNRKEVHIPLDLVFSGHGYTQHEEPKWEGFYCLQYHVYIIPEGVFLKYEITLHTAMGWGTGVG